MRTDQKRALLAASSSNEGAPVPAISQVQRALQEIGMVGPNGGLTRAGAIQRDRLLSEELDRAFGA